MKTLSLIVAFLLLASVSPAAAQYSFSGSPAAVRTAPAKPALGPTARPSNPSPPKFVGTGPHAAEGNRTQQAPKPPSSTGVPINNIPGQARAIPGMPR
jgi:hypothetical protein